ncbi:hypothetical protein [Neptuniibacter sp. QD37_11]|uniref:hypothetical protein n=1 Tax=Neptuniibacter sp. QD37_11 TaxID=3398209 RepID=UPI0039F50F63
MTFYKFNKLCFSIFRKDYPQEQSVCSYAATSFACILGVLCVMPLFMAGLLHFIFSALNKYGVQTGAYEALTLLQHYLAFDLDWNVITTPFVVLPYLIGYGGVMFVLLIAAICGALFVAAWVGTVIVLAVTPLIQTHDISGTPNWLRTRIINPVKSLKPKVCKTIHFE